VTAPDTPLAIDAVWRIESPRLIAGLTRMVRDVARAEDLAQDALVAALEQWPRTGIPDNPGAWLMAAAKNKAIDQLRHDKMADRVHEEIAARRRSDEPEENEFGDDMLRLIFMTCHPVLAPDARTALTLRLVGGLTTDEIARAYLVPEPTMAQRLVRAKKTLTEAKVPFEVPEGPELAERLASVLEVLYLIFNEGYSATAGSDWVRPGLCEDAMRLGRVLAELAPLEPEVHGLVALMEIQASRFGARVGSGGEPILLLDQNRARWDHLLIRRGLAALQRAEKLGGRGPYMLQASIAACHARATTAGETDWARIVSLYGELGALTPSPVIELNRAVAVEKASGAAAALEIVDGLADALRDYHLLFTVRGDLLFKLGRRAEARAAFERAAEGTRNERERALMLRRAAECT